MSDTITVFCPACGLATDERRATPGMAFNRGQGWHPVATFHCGYCGHKFQKNDFKISKPVPLPAGDAAPAADAGEVTPEP